ncbi:MAG: fumarate hydratase [Candidatus Margulisiibacteriota bacterium]|nr:fumarate hydratase [Candidatus Margulisiibacteriota bacterium]
MREVVAKKITDTVKKLCVEATTSLPEDVTGALNKALAKETSPTGREIIRQLINNSKTAWREKLPICQDTGLAIIFLEVGQDVAIINGVLEEAINEGVSRGYAQLRKSVAKDPLRRKNSGDNTPAIIHTKIVPGENIKLSLMAKGGGAENCSAVKMFNPNSRKGEISEFILDTVKNAGPNACPPMIVGVGIGGSFDYAPIIAKKALFREIGMHNSEKNMADWEKELLDKTNKTGIGPMGMGGKITALAVNIEKRPCHISSLPVAINIECHAHRVKHAEI